MEREIEELERAVLENCRLLEEVEGAKPKRFQERHAADGYSTARPQRPLEAGWTPPHSASENQSTERPQRPLEAVHWGAVVDLVKSTLTLGPLTVDLQPEKRTRKRQRTRKVSPRGVVPAVAVQIQAVPAAAVQVVPAAAVQAVPAATVQAIPVAAVQAVPEAAVQAVPAGTVQAVPAAAVPVVQAVEVQAVPAAAVQVVPAVTVQAVPEAAVQAVPAAVQAVPAAAVRVVQAVEVQADEAQAVPVATVQAVPAAAVQVAEAVEVQAVPAAAVQAVPAVTDQAVQVQAVPAAVVEVQAVEVQAVPEPAVPAAVVPDVAVPAVAVPAVVPAAVQAADHRSPTPAGACTASPRAIPPPSTETVNAVKELWQRSSEGLDQCQKEQLRHLLDRYVDIFAARDEDCTQTRLVQHSIDTGSAPPIRLRPHRLALSKRQLAEDMIHKMLAAGIIEPSSSPWAAPVVLVRKRLGGWRFCVDYRRLNAVTKKDSYPLPRIDDALDYISGSSWFSSLDMRSGYWQVELSPQARAKTAFTFGQGLWQFRVMPFGLCNAPATFERLMERVLADIPRSHCVVYLDDLLVHASDFSKALGHLSGVFSAIRHAGLRLNPAKCHLLQRNFLGLASYYRRFVRNFASVAGPLHRLTDKGKPFAWTNSCDTAFNQLKAALTAAPILAYPHVDLPYVVDTDASGTGIGAVLSQQGGEGERVVGYYSRALSREERNYCVTRRELLAVVMAVHHFRPYLHGNKFLLRTDHASLTWLLSFKQPEGQVARWLEVLQTYDFDIQHRPGQQHNNADALSRRPCVIAECRYCERQEERDRDKPRVSTATINPPDDLSSEQLQQQQESDTTLALIRKWLELPRRPEWPAVSPHGTDIKAYYSQWGNIELRNGLLFRRSFRVCTVQSAQATLASPRPSIGFGDVSTGPAADRTWKYMCIAVICALLGKVPPSAHMPPFSNTWSGLQWNE
uniref:ribonuclease H n=2 Tax=Knipowitschia caucasica TaxID=637954 RepID=A0AAV2K2W5_KNICA